jgi:hypothetical protein
VLIMGYDGVNIDPPLIKMIHISKWGMFVN